MEHYEPASPRDIAQFQQQISLGGQNKGLAGASYGNSTVPADQRPRSLEAVVSNFYGLLKELDEAAHIAGVIADRLGGPFAEPARVDTEEGPHSGILDTFYGISASLSLSVMRLRESQRRVQQSIG